MSQKSPAGRRGYRNPLRPAGRAMRCPSPLRFVHRQVALEEEVSDDARHDGADEDAQLGFVQQGHADVWHIDKRQVGDEE